MKNEQIEGKNVKKFMKDLTGDLFNSINSFFVFVFGLKFLKMGIRECDRLNNRKVQLYLAWGKDIVNKRMKKIKEKFEKKGMEE